MTYPANILSADEALIKDQVEIEFTDPDNQPASASGPIHAAASGSTPLMVDSPDGDPIIAFDADTSRLDSFYTWDFGGQDLGNVGSVQANGNIDGLSLGQTIPYASVQAGPPDPLDSYLTPLVFDTTAVSGGLYAWDGTQYQQVGGPLA